MVIFMNKNKTVINLLILGLISYFVKFLFNVFAAEHLSPELYGDFSIALRGVFIISLLLLMGTNIASVKYISLYFTDKNPENATRFIKWNLKLVTKTFLIAFIVFTAIFLLLLFMHHLNFTNLGEHHYFVYALWLAPFSALLLLLSSVILSNRQNSLSLFFNKIAIYILLILFMAATVFFLDITIGFFHLMLFLFLGFLLIIIVELFLVNKILIKHEVNITQKLINLKLKVHKKEWMSDSLSLTSGQIIFNLVCFFDLLVIEWVHPNEHSVGHYAAMQTIVNILWVVPSSVTSYFVPLITPLLEKKKYKELQSHIDSANYVSLFVSVVMLSLIIVFSEYILSLFGPSYIYAEIPLIVLSVVYFIGAAAFSNARILTFLDPKMIMLINTCELAVLIITSFPLTYYFGILGMTFAVLISVTTKTCFMYIYVKKKIPIKPFSLM